MAVKKIGTLNKHENPATNENEFDIENYMNANWDKIKEVVDNNAGELTSTQEKATTLQENVEEIEGNITELQTEQATQNQKIEQLDDDQIHITTEKAESINAQDCSGQNAKIKLFGVSKQEGTPSPGSPIEIENTTGNVDITDCNKNLFNKESYDALSDYAVQMEGNMSSYKGKSLQLKPNTTYAVSRLINNYVAVGSWVLYILDADKQTILTVLQELSYKSDIKTTITTGETGIVYIAEIYATDEKLQDFFSKCNIQIEENNIATEYIEHEQQVTTFPLQEGQKMYEGSYLADDGIHHKRKQIELDGTENWDIGSTTSLRYSIRLGLQDIKLKTTNLTTGILSNCFLPDGSSENSTGYEDKFTFRQANGSKNLWFFVPKNFFTTTTSTEILAEWKAYLSAQKTAETPVIVEYPLAEETIEAYTEEQQTADNQLQNAKTYKTVTNVFTENAELEMEYIAHTKTYVDNEINSVKEQLNTIKELLSTTTTSAMLLDNMQTDLESEVL